MNSFTHAYCASGLELTNIIRLLRVLDEKHQAAVAGIVGSTIQLRCKDETAYQAWVTAFEEFILAVSPHAAAASPAPSGLVLAVAEDE